MLRAADLGEPDGHEVRYGIVERKLVTLELVANGLRMAGLEEVVARHVVHHSLGVRRNTPFGIESLFGHRSPHASMSNSRNSPHRLESRPECGVAVIGIKR